MTSIVVNFDGLCEPVNPGGYACWAFVAFSADGEEIHHDAGCLGHEPSTTNNIAEYQALIEALKWLIETGRKHIVIRGDSRLVINQVIGEWACRAPHLQRLLVQTMPLIRQVGIFMQWVPREQNEVADRYSLEAYKLAAGITGEVVRLDHKHKRR